MNSARDRMTASASPPMAATSRFRSSAVVIGDDFEVGANTTIAEAMGDPIIEDAVKLDHQVQIATTA